MYELYGCTSVSGYVTFVTLYNIKYRILNRLSYHTHPLKSILLITAIKYEHLAPKKDRTKLTTQAYQAHDVVGG